MGFFLLTYVNRKKPIPSRQWEKNELQAIAHGKKPDLKAIRQEFHEKSGLSRVNVALSKYQKLLKPSN
jgi:hypothetical protein